jgi:enediyne biosynthesis protein E4
MKLVGTVSNRQGLGAKVALQAGGITQFREMNGANGHFYGEGSTPLHFGLGAATVINPITVQWPSGSTQTLRRVSADREITVTETP